ncbi:iron chelate uptake ABC transporter family permease subunit [Gordonia sp. TBRC 11910]|uniref:Iron chelate uptake ABC transporter family permease subunit n=1 Tax=Gordonia asplenii TaxID=2725283 RepID=A0A848KZX0_9ACTN|nr:iron chelate uptake ABC transporter family permease subunit [Gordonia asplenii]NMO00988.1 iron chelate uptake ABC transporter family permease subunit [Gordonia asplenii]
MTVDFGRPQIVVRAGGLSVRGDRRSVVVGLTVLAALVISVVVALGSGTYPLGPGQVLGALFVGDDPAARLAVWDWQLPRVLAAVTLGAALASSGLIFQLLTRNPLGSPDLIGFGVGSYTGALIAGLVLGGSFAMTSMGALAGGILTAGAVYLLAFRTGVAGFRLVITGVAISSMLAAVNYWLILRADLDQAMSAALWGAGTLETATWAMAGPASIVVVILLTAFGLLSRRAPVVELGPELARTLGAQTRLAAVGLPVLGVALTAVATTVAGPIAFVALSAPHIARRLCRSGHTPPMVTGLVGSLLLVVSDVIAVRLFAPTTLPVGVVTVCLGGVYLCYLLFSEMRRAK